jgi:Fe2+ or Zn2+ uptake regulation protein
MSKDDIVHEWMSRLQANGYRLTGPRYIIIQTLAVSNKALNASDIFDQARKSQPTISLVSIYRTLGKLEKLGLIQRVHQQDGCHAYIANVAGHQHILLCEKCGFVEYFHGDDLDVLVTRVERESGFQIRDHWLQLLGLCARCR